MFMGEVGLLQPEVAELDGAALALECDVTLGGVGGALVLQVAVDINGDLAALADYGCLVPLAYGLLVVACAILNGELANALDIRDLRAAQHYIITSTTCAQLNLDSVRPYLIAILNTVEEATIGALAYPAPLHMHSVVAVLLVGTHITEGLADDVDVAILYAINISCGNIALAIDNKNPTRKIFTIEQLGA